MDKQIIFLDIDGTLTEPGQNVPPESALKAIRRSQEKGNKVFLCTGRNYDMLSPLLQYGFDGYIGCNGGYVVCGNQLIYDCPMTEEQRVTAMDVLQKNGIYRTVECRDGSFTDEAFKEYLRNNKDEGGNSEMLRWREQIEKSLNIRPMAEYENQPAYKIVIMVRDLEMLEEPKAVLGDEFNFCMQESKHGITNGEVINVKFDKGQAVRRVCDYYHIPIENTVAFGDSMNDCEMMEAAALSICMENGADALKEISDEVCPAVTEDGLYKAFEKHGLM